MCSTNNYPALTLLLDVISERDYWNVTEHGSPWLLILRNQLG